MMPIRRADRRRDALAVRLAAVLAAVLLAWPRPAGVLAGVRVAEVRVRVGGTGATLGAVAGAAIVDPRGTALLGVSTADVATARRELAAAPPRADLAPGVVAAAGAVLPVRAVSAVRAVRAVRAVSAVRAVAAGGAVRAVPAVV